jgi:uncharacterized protein (TIRG00374 family)
VAAGSVADRVVDTLSVFALACLGAALCGGAEAVVLRVGGVLGLIASGGLGLTLILRRLPLDGRVGRSIHELGASLDAVRRRPGALALCLFLSLSVQVAFVGVNVLLASESGVEVPAAAWFFAWSVAKLVAVLPISAGGLGVREASLAALLSPFGAPAERVVAVGLMWQSILLASGLLGGAVLLVISRSKRREVQAAK